MAGAEAFTHEHFEKLCAIAALGQLSAEEASELEEHLGRCEACRDCGRDFEQLVHERLPLAGSQKERFREKLLFLMRSGAYRKRFRARAQAAGIALTPPAPSYRLALLATSVALIALVAIAGFRLREAASEYRALAREYDKLTGRIAGLEHRLAERETAPASPNQTPPPARTHDDEALRQELTRVRVEWDKAQAGSRNLEDQVKRATLEIDSLRAEISTAKGAEEQAIAKLKEAEVSLGRASTELATLRRSGTDDSTRLVAHQTRIRELTEQLSASSDSIERERKLLAADRDIRDLMGARSLHIVDVYDVDGKGKTRPPFGRVFYTEGKSLIFYAFDLGANRNTRANASFQAWGRLESKQDSARSLGIFYVDDQKQNRWVLQFDDPKVLAQIDAVFVTVEPPGGSPRPNGQKLLYAYLNANPNHP